MREKIIIFKEIQQWLTKNIHEKGKTMLSEKIIEHATGNKLNSKVFTNYLNNKYSKIYGY